MPLAVIGPPTGMRVTLGRPRRGMGRSYLLHHEQGPETQATSVRCSVEVRLCVDFIP